MRLHNSHNRRWHELCHQWQKGDSVAAEMLMVETRPWLVARARLYRQQMQDNDIEDVVQAAQLSFFRNLDRIDQRGPCGLLLVILYRAINRLVQLQDGARGTQSIGPAEDTDGGSGIDPCDTDILTPDVAVEQDETTAHVLDCVNSLPENQRIAIQLKYFENMSYREVAEILGITSDAVKNLLQAARKSLKEHFARLNL